MKNNLLKELVNRTNLTNQKKDLELIIRDNFLYGGSKNGVCGNKKDSPTTTTINLDALCTTSNSSCNSSCTQ
jgi:hypothetical protein